MKKVKIKCQEENSYMALLINILDITINIKEYFML